MDVVTGPDNGGFAQPYTSEDMDIDMDLDLTIDHSYEINQVEAAEARNSDFGGNGATFSTTATLVDDSLQIDADPLPDRIHVRGLDSLSNQEVKAFASEHYPSDDFVKVEWINDTAANLIYQTPEAALAALHALTVPQDIPASQIPPLQLRPAKKLSTHPLTDLYIRQATSADVKKKNAYDESRYYLLHPDQDPREKRRHQDTGRPRHRRGSNEEGNYSRRRYDDRENRKRRLDDVFTASMYDEEPTFLSDTDGRGRSKRVRFGRDREDLTEGRLKHDVGRLRDRSASPGRRHDGDGRYGFASDEETAFQRRIRTRSPTPPRRRVGGRGKELFPDLVNARKELFADGLNGRKELFPDRVNANKELFPGGLNGGKELFPELANEGEELFPQVGNGSASFLSRVDSSSQELASDKLSTKRSSRELFPNRTERSNHRRTEAVDHSPHASVEIVNGLNGFPEPNPRSFADRISRGSSSSLADRITSSNSLASRISNSTPSLADRITGGPELTIKNAANTSGLRIRGSAANAGGLSIKGAAANAEGLSIRGAANAGFSVRGAAERAAKQSEANPNAGKELFAERLTGRGGPRRRAEDMW